MAYLQALSVVQGDERIRTAAPAQRTDTAPIDPHVGHRLASLADGEGCFSITRTALKSGRDGHTYVASFIVNLRADDRPYLELFRDLTGLGTIYDIKKNRSPGRNNNPGVRWAIQRQADCRALCAIFDEYPLWSKKQADYLIWRRVFERATVTKAELERAFFDLRDARVFRSAVSGHRPDVSGSIRGAA